ncbi:MAG: translation initiation factor IF-2 N-terminal domain-containing protein, partial [Opitutales bacterium]
MSVRIYQLSKEIGVDNSELIQILRARGHDVKSASSTVDNISADSLRDEYAEASRKKLQPAPQEKAEPAVAAPIEVPAPRIAAPRPAPELPRAQMAVPPPAAHMRSPGIGAAPMVPPPMAGGKTPPMVRMAPGRVPPPVVQPRGGSGNYSGPPSREVTQSAQNAAPSPVIGGGLRPPRVDIQIPVRPAVTRQPEPGSAPVREAPKPRQEIELPAARPSGMNAPSTPPPVHQPKGSPRPPAIPQMAPRIQTAPSARTHTVATPHISAPPAPALPPP